MFKFLKELFTPKLRTLTINVVVSGNLKHKWVDALQISQIAGGVPTPKAGSENVPNATDSGKGPDPVINFDSDIQLPKVKFGKDVE